MDLAQATIHKSGNSLHVSHGDDKGLYVLFHYEAVEVPFRSEQEKRPIFEDRPFITILFPGDNTRKTVRPVKMEADTSGPSDPERWPRQWAAFQSQSEQPSIGTPLTEWASITKSQAMMLKGLQIHSVDQLAAVPDHALNWLGAREMKQKAIEFLKQHEHGRQEIDALHAQLADAQAARDAQAAQIAELQAQMQKLIDAQQAPHLSEPEAKPRAKPGPKPKSPKPSTNQEQA
jgi:hypothetical protein